MPERLRNKKIVFRSEGGVVYEAESEDGKLYLVVDESTIADFLSDEDIEDLQQQKIYEFENIEERRDYTKSRGWV
ncbi:MAG: hypothetical protein ACE5HI_18345 [bacterium]